MKSKEPSDDKFACFVCSLNLSGLTAAKIILWLIAITIASLVISVAILAVSGDLSSSLENHASPFRHDSLFAPETIAIARDGAQDAGISITLGAGKLSLREGAPDDSLADVSVFSHAKEWQPEIRQSVNGTTRIVTITDPGHKGKEWFSVNSPNRWDIQITDKVPVDLRLDVGAGDSTLDLASLNLTKLVMNNGAGETRIDLGKYHKNPFTAEIHNGVGELTLRMPEKSNTRITVQQGVGDIKNNGFEQHDDQYTTKGYNPALPANEILISQGVGDVTLDAV